MKQGHINIHGTIGSFTDGKGQEIKGVELLDVIAQVKSQPNATSFLVHIGSPGGLVDAGNQIYDYLQSLKQQGTQIDTISDSYVTPEGEVRSGIGSIATKAFLAGTNRTIIEGHEFFIHNPWTQPQPGDSNQIALELQALKQTEAELRSFYQQHTSVTDAGLKGLMDNETGMSADQALTLGFATKKIAAQKIKAFAQLKNNMAKENETVGQKFGKVLDMMLGNTQPAAPAPTTPPAPAPTKAMVPLELEGGVKVTSSAEDPNNLNGSDVTDEAGQPLPDGEHKLADGRVLVVAAGKVAEVKMPAAAAAPAALPTPPVAPVPTALEQALQAKVTALETELATMKTGTQAQIDEAINALKDSLVSGKSPAKAINNNGNNGTPAVATRSIAQVMAQKQADRKKQLNKN